MSRGWKAGAALGLGLLVAGSAASGDPRPDSSSVAAPSPADSIAHALPSLTDSAVLALPAIPADSARTILAPRRMQDTVTVFPGITIDGALPVPPRTTATTTRLDRSAIVRFLPLTPADAMVSVPGVDLVKMGPWASRVSFRGFQGERVLVLVDGVRLNTGRGHGSNASLVSVDRLDQIELTAGSGGATYGSDAVGGVVNLATHRPLFARDPSLTLTASARASEPGDQVAQSLRLRLMTRRLGAELAGGAGWLDALVTPEGRVPNSGSRDQDLGARVAVRLGDGFLDLEHTLHAARDVGLPALSGRYPLVSREADRLEIEHPFMASPFGWALPGHARLLAADQRYKSDFDETIVDTVYSQRTLKPIATNSAVGQDRVTTRSSGVQPEIHFGQRGELRLAGELRRETTSGPKSTTTTTRTIAGAVTGVQDSVLESVPRAQRDVLALSLASRSVAGPLTLEAGARYDWLRSTADSTELSWAPALDVVDERLSVDGGFALRVVSVEPYARIATGFRAPNLEERYYRGPVHGGMDVWGDPALVAEQSVSYEAGVRASGDGWGSLRASVYRTYAEDFITLRYLLLQYGRPRFQYANLRKVQVDGVEFTGRARLRSASISVSATLPRGTDLSTGERLVDVGVSRVALDFASPVGRWLPSGMFALRARWSDGVPTDPLKEEQLGLLTRPAFWTLAAEVGTTLAGTRLTFAVANLLDNDYREPLSFIDEPGRTFSFALRRDFVLPVFSSREQERP